MDDKKFYPARDDIRIRLTPYDWPNSYLFLIDYIVDGYVDPVSKVADWDPDKMTPGEHRTRFWLKALEIGLYVEIDPDTNLYCYITPERFQHEKDIHVPIPRWG